MPTTEHIHLPLYTDEETPDLSTTGHYNHAMEILDAEAGELENSLAEETKQRKAADAELEGKVEEEATARADADKAINDTLATKADSADVTALGKRVDNAEVEISANSADLTGIKGLTYGTGQRVFLEEENGEYSSPALEEIQHEISNLQADGWYILPRTTDMNAETYQKLREHWPKCAIRVSVEITGANAATYDTLYRPYTIGDSWMRFMFLLAIGYTADKRSEGRLMFAITRWGLDGDGNITSRSTNSLYIPQQFNTWLNLASKPFSTIGSGLKVVSDALTVDTSALPSGSGLTVINVGEKTPADLYAEIQAAWPNCLLTTQTSGSPYYYPVSSTSSSYRFAGQVTNKGFVLIAVRANAIADTPVEFTTGNSTWGDLEQQVAV